VYAKECSHTVLLIDPSWNLVSSVELPKMPEKNPDSPFASQWASDGEWVCQYRKRTDHFDHPEFVFMTDLSFGPGSGVRLRFRRTVLGSA
jgi:hypothetical protein